MTTTTTPTRPLRDGTAAGTWTLDPAASTVTTATRHFWGLITVRGVFADKTGHATVTADGVVNAELEVDAASIDTKNDKRDAHLRSSDFFATDEHPTITFTTTEVTLTGDAAAHVTGTVTAGGAHQDVSFDATLAGDADTATVTAEAVAGRRAIIDGLASLDELAPQPGADAQTTRRMLNCGVRSDCMSAANITK